MSSMVAINPAPDTMVQKPLATRSRQGKLHALESFIVFAFFTVAFAALGYHTVTQLHVVSFEALDQTTRALMVWHNDPAKLAALGFDYPPLTAIAYVLFGVSRTLVESLVAMPLTSAVFAGFAFMVINRMFERLDMPLPIRYIILFVFAFNPLIAFYASNGVSEIIGISLLALAMSSLLSWYVTLDLRYLFGASLTFALAVLADYEALLWMILAVVMVIVVLHKHRAAKEETESSAMVFMVAPLFGIVIWTLFNWLILSDPFAWVGVSTVSDQAASISFIQALETTVDLVWAVSPLTFVILPLLIIAAISKGSELAAWFAGFVLMAVFSPTVQALISDDAAYLRLRSGISILFITLIGAGVLYYLFKSLRLFVAIGIIVGLLLSIPVTWQAMEQYKYQNSEQAFHRAISTGKSQEGTSTLTKEEIGIVSEQAMANRIESLKIKNNEILTDNAQTFGVIALTGHPELFYNRAGAGDEQWRQRVKSLKSVKYVLFNNNNTDKNDFLNQTYPNLNKGTDPKFQIVYTTPRYTLAKVTGGQ